MRPPAEQLQLMASRAGLLVIDVQERLAAAMPSEGMTNVTRQCQVLIEGAKILNLPVWVTEQYPKGIGPTLPVLTQALPESTNPVTKLDFSCMAVDAVTSMIASSGRNQIIVCGMETHICVFQTVRDLVLQGYDVFVAQDAVISRTRENREIGLRLMERAGAILSSTESLLFDLLRKAGSPEFKQISALIK